MVKTKPIYKLGHAVFTVTHADPHFEPVLSRLLPLCDRSTGNCDKPIDVKMGFSAEIALLIERLIEQHRNCMFIRAACLLSPNGGKILIAGGSDSGKTTLAVALARGYQWKVLSENLTIIDPECGNVISLGAPFQIKDGTREQLTDAGIQLPPFILRQWYPLASELIGQDSQAVFDLAVHLDGQVSQEPLNCERCTPAEYLRMILPTSNLLSLRRTGQFLEYLSAKGCFRFSGGNVSARLQAVFDLCAGADEQKKFSHKNSSSTCLETPSAKESCN